MTFDHYGVIKNIECDHISVYLYIFDVKLVESAEGRVSEVDLSCCCGYSGKLQTGCVTLRRRA